MSINHFGILVVGSACHDHTLYAGDLSRNFRNGTLGNKSNPLITPEHPDGTSNRAGGSALNTSLAITPIASSFDSKATIYKCMRLGREENNPGKKLILKELGNPKPGDKTLMDAMCGREDYAVPTNTVIENGCEVRDRHIIRGYKADLPVNPQIVDELSHAVSQCKVVIGNSSPAEETLVAFNLAKQMGVMTMLDYSEKEDQKIISLAPDMLHLADVVVAPHDALLPGMSREDPQELFRALVEDYGCNHVAISNSNESVMVYDNGRTFKLDIPVVNVVNACGAGDTRDAALGVAMALDYPFEKAIKAASDIATFYVQQPTRAAFEQKLPEHIKFSPLYRHPLHVENGRNQQSEGWGLAAAMA